VKRSRFSVEQIVAVLKQADLGMSVADVIRKIGVSEQTFYRWKRQYVSLEPDQAREYKHCHGQLK
jgi:putative transposase